MRSTCTSLLSGALLLGAASASPLTQLKARAPAVGVPITSCTVPGTVAIAFDDGPFLYTAKALDILRDAGVPATFFVNGDNWAQIGNFAGDIQRIINEGHQLGSHTWSHPHLPQISDADVRTQMTRLEDTLVTMVGKYPTYMRPPYLEFSDATLGVLGSLGYKVISMNADTVDWDNNTPQTWPNALNNFVTALNAGGSLVLLHDVHQTTVENLLPEMIRVIKEKGLKAVTVGDCLGDPAANWYATSRGGSTSAPPPPTNNPPPTSTPGEGPDSTCGGTQQYHCGSGKCCSQYGYCGMTAEYCAAGCQPLFGRCD